MQPGNASAFQGCRVDKCQPLGSVLADDDVALVRLTDCPLATATVNDGCQDGDVFHGNAADVGCNVCSNTDVDVVVRGDYDEAGTAAAILQSPRSVATRKVTTAARALWVRTRDPDGTRGDGRA